MADPARLSRKAEKTWSRMRGAVIASAILGRDDFTPPDESVHDRVAAEEEAARLRDAAEAEWSRLRGSLLTAITISKADWG